MNEIKEFKNVEFGNVRVMTINNKEYFVANDIAKALGYKKPNDAVNQHCRSTVKHSIPHPQSKDKTMEVNIITEGDMYRLITHSGLPSAEKFETWVFDDVLPTIRKTGGYVNSDELFIDTYLNGVTDDVKQLFRLNLTVLKQKDEVIKKQREEIEYKEDVIIGLVDEITIAEKRQILNRVVKHKRADYRQRWNLLHREFENKYHCNVQQRLDTYNETHKPKCKNKVDYIDKVMNKIPELYEIATKLFESDVKELVEEMYALTSREVS